MRRFAAIRRAAVVVAAFTFVSCGGDHVAGPPAPATIAVSPGADTVVTLGRTRQFTAQPLDAAGGPVAATVVWRSSNPAVATVDSATGLVTAVGNGIAIIRAVSGSITGQASLFVAQVVATVQLTPTSLSFTSVGDTGRFAAVAKDSSGAVVASVRFLWVSSNGAVATVDTGGLATSRGVGSAFVTAAGRGVPGSAGVSVTQAATQFVFTVQPANAVAGEALNPAVEVEIRDARGNLVTSARNTVTIGLQANPGSAVLHGTTTVNAIGGVASFSGLTIEKASAGYTLGAAATGIAAGTSAAFNVAAAAAERLAFTSPPVSPVTAGGDMGLVVAAQDRFGNTVPGAAGPVRLVIALNPGADTLVGTTTVNLASGIAAFPGVNLRRAHAGYTLRATTVGLDTANTAQFTVNPAPPSQLVFADEFIGGYGFGPFLPFTVRVEDPFGNLVDTSTASVTIGILSQPWTGASIYGRANVSAVEGIATFDSLIIDRPGLGYTLGAFAGALTGTISNVSVSLFFGQYDDLAAGANHACGVTVYGTYCWGDNTSLQISLSGTMDSVPLLMGLGRFFYGLSSRGNHTCALSGTDAYCWGSNSAGQLGTGGIGGGKGVPSLVQGGGTWAQVSAGGSHTCALSTAGTVSCWGDNTFGQLGDHNAPTGSPSPVLAAGGRQFVEVAAGGQHTCARTATGDAYCWGRGNSGQLGEGGGAAFRDTAALVLGGHIFVQLAAGDAHTCGLASSAVDDPVAVVHCWGANADGQLGHGAGNGVSQPAVVDTSALGLTFVSPGLLSAGARHNCVISTFAVPWCWGANDAGQLGDNNALTNSAVPVRVVGTEHLTWSRIAAGGSFTCADATGFETGYDPGLYCWGDNSRGQLGNGTRVNSPTMVRSVQ